MVPSRRLDVLLYLDDPASAGEQAADRVVVAIDVLRATSTILVALSQGAAAVVPAATLQEAHHLKATRFPDALLCGERHNRPPEGFDLGNSPAEYTRERVKDKLLLLTTTNGTRLIRALAPAREVWIGGFLNLSAVCRQILGLSGDVLLACAGSHRRYAMEDGLLAGAIVEAVAGAFDQLSDSARLVLAAWRGRGLPLPEALAQTEHGQRLRADGFERDIRLAAAVDRIGLVPRLVEGRVLISSGSPN
ncbi:MAG: putative 2-phosphosulfolactate phosphatase [Candidatus Poribacteria bacterium]|nr:MAG: putative 2-phosphosulfolactate phosphatase [Candidatus Poribacteria bacterium]